MDQPLSRALTHEPVSARIVLMGPPVGKQRPRVFRQDGKLYANTPEKTKVFERALQTLARVSLPRGWPLDARYRVAVVATFGDKRRRDLDNVLKSCLDAMIGVAYDDDSQVDEMAISRAAGTEATSNTEVVISVLGTCSRRRLM